METIFRIILVLVVLAIFIGGPLLIVILAVWAIKTGPRRRREQYQKFANSIGGEVVNDQKGNPVCVRVVKDGVEIKLADRQETEVRHHYNRREEEIETNRRHFHYFIMESSGKFGFEVFITPDSAVWAVAERMGKVTDIEIGDPEFDQKYLISARDPAPVSAFFSSPARRSALEALFNLNFKEFWVSQDAIILRKGFQPSRDLDLTRLQQYVAQFAQLVRG